MIPDFATITRRRHFVTMLLRATIVVFGAWAAWDFLVEFNSNIVDLASGSPFQSMYFIRPFLIALPRLVALAALFFAQGPLVRWIVPLPSRDPGCPKCGYSLKNLNSPICPECGTNLRD